MITMPCDPHNMMNMPCDPHNMIIMQAACDAHIASQLSSLKSGVSLEVITFLDKAHSVWRDYCRQMLTIRSIFLYLDRSYVASGQLGGGLRSLFDMGLALFRQHLLSLPQVRRV